MRQWHTFNSLSIMMLCSVAIFFMAAQVTIPLPAVASITHGMKSRIQLSGEIDDNIGEDSGNMISGQAIRFLSATQGKGTLSNSLPYRYDVFLGYRAYQTYHDENRLVLKLGSGLTYALAKRMYWGVDGNVFIEDYKTEGRNNSIALASVYCQIPQSILRLLELQFQFQNAKTQYPHDPFFDFSDNWWSINLRRTMSRKLSLWTGYSYHPRQFERKALLFVPSAFGGSVVNTILPAAFRQKDILNEFSLGGQYYHKFLISAFIVFRNTKSNSYGFSKWEQRLSMLAGAPFFFDSLLKLYLTFEAKKYNEKLSFPIITDIDEDKEEDNRFIVELSKDLFPSLAVEIRYEWLHNESRIRNLYYGKHVISSGLEFSF